MHALQFWWMSGDVWVWLLNNDQWLQGVARSCTMVACKWNLPSKCQNRSRRLWIEPKLWAVDGVSTTKVHVRRAQCGEFVCQLRRSMWDRFLLLFSKFALILFLIRHEILIAGDPCALDWRLQKTNGRLMYLGSSFGVIPAVFEQHKRRMHKYIQLPCVYRCAFRGNNQDSRGYNWRSRGYNRGSRGYNQRSQGYNCGSHGYERGYWIHNFAPPNIDGACASVRGEIEVVRQLIGLVAAATCERLHMLKRQTWFLRTHTHKTNPKCFHRFVCLQAICAGFI